MREPQTVLENITCMYAYQGMLTCNQPATRFTTIYHNLPRFTTIYHSLPQFTTAEVVAVAWHGRTVVCVNHEFSIQNDEFCISNDRFCISNDEFRTDLCGIFPARSALSSAGCQPLASGVPSGSSRSCCSVRNAEGRWVLLGSPACLRRPLAVLVFWGGAPL